MTTTIARRRSAELEELIDRDAAAFRILTGDRPTGRLHLGHYFGTLRNRVRLQDLGAEVFVLIADYQVLTDRDTADHLDEYVTGLLLDYLAIGLDPAQTVIFAHSAVPALNQLLLPFLSLVSVPELNRNPTVKDEIAHSGQPAVSGLMLTYPVHQAADILFCKANLVPVGQDQLPHLELTRVIARRFNDRFGLPVFGVPDALLSAAPLLLGTDGTKMSKSRGNTVPLSATADETARLIRGAQTDSERHISYDPVSTTPFIQLRRHDGPVKADGMGFFDELPAPEPEPVRRHHPWDPPEAEFPGNVPMDSLVLGRTDEVAVAVTGISAYSNGMEIFVAARIRPGGRPEDHAPGGQRDLAASRRSFRFGLQLADGSKVVGRPGRWPEHDSEPAGPVLFPFAGGGGLHSFVSRWWAWPLPPKGPLEFVCEWPKFGIAESRADLDAQLILDAADRSIRLWPEEEG